MNKNFLKLLLPIVAIVVIVESLTLLTKQKVVPVVVNDISKKVIPTIVPEIVKSISFKWNVDVKSLKIGVNGQIPLSIVSDKDIFVDAVDLYIKYDPSSVLVSGITVGTDFVTPTFKKISEEKGLVVMNFLVSEAGGYKLKKGIPIEILKLKVKYTTAGNIEFGLANNTLVVENATAKVLPFNSDKLVINVSR